MADIKELREKRGKAINDMRELVNRSETAGNANLSAEDQKIYDKHFNDQDSLSNQIKQEEALQNLERDTISNELKDGDLKKPAAPANDEDRKLLAFRSALLNGVHGVPVDLRNALSFDDDTEGGYLSAPQKFVEQLIKAVDDQVFMRTKATIHQLHGAHSLGAPSLDNDPSDSDWTSEIGAVTEDTVMSFGKRELKPEMLTKLVKVSMKLLHNSAMPPEGIVLSRMAYKFGITQEKAFLTGTGASQPLGVFTASAQGISTGRDVSTGNSTTAVTFDGLINAKYSLKGQYWSRADWMFHRDGMKQISKLKDGDGQYMWRPSVRDGEPDMLLGRPISMSEYVPNTFTTGLYVGMLGDFSQYWIADSLTMTIQRLNELYAANNQIGFIGRLESDGAPVLEEAFARVKLA
ncbi:MAG: phage major capsid protein [Desulfobacterales bacterium]